MSIIQFDPNGNNPFAFEQPKSLRPKQGEPNTHSSNLDWMKSLRKVAETHGFNKFLIGDVYKGNFYQVNLSIQNLLASENPEALYAFEDGANKTLLQAVLSSSIGSQNHVADSVAITIARFYRDTKPELLSHVDNDGFTARDYAIKNKFSDTLIKILPENGAKVSKTQRPKIIVENATNTQGAETQKGKVIQAKFR